MSNPDEKPPRSRVVAARIITHEDGETEYEGDPEAIADAKEAMARSMAREERRRELWGEIGPGAMTRLARLFPSLRDADGVEPWDSINLLRWALSGKSHGEALAAKFVLSVWNSTTDWEEIARDHGIITEPDHHFSRFDLYEAMGVWDYEHVNAMLAWLQLPFWP
jgi:hypothetical protein